jgi:hypothetical protein|tara:strand:+ start:134 stop:532 length:399 start_codon:yes stop_codon:yes gene_type:complete
MKDKTCEERIDEKLENCLHDLRILWEADKRGEEYVDDLGCFAEYGLCFDYVESEDTDNYFRYQISWGGPASEYRFYTNSDLEPYAIDYWFLDWFDGAKRELTGKDWDLLLEIFEFFSDCGTVESVFNAAIAD